MEETKICTICGLEKPLIEFNFKNKSLGKRWAMCKECQRARERELYETSYRHKNKDRYRDNRKKYREKLRQLILEAKSCGCIICGEKESCCLDFHHLRDKEFVIAAGPDVSIARLLKELDKCIVLCANCHRKLHAGLLTIRSGDEPEGATNTEKTVNNKQLIRMEIKFKKLDPRAVAPVRAHNTDAGFDLTATRITTEINECGQLILVYHTDLAFEIPEGYFGLMVPRSSIFKKSLMFTNCAGVIDSGYRGEVMGKFKTTTDVIPAVFKEGERFCQLLILPVPEVQMVEAESLSETDRGENGYGSTGETTLNEQSAPTGSIGYPEQKSELIDQQTANDGSGGAQSGPEQAE